MNAFSSEELRQFDRSTVSTFFSSARRLWGTKLAELNLQAGRTGLTESVARVRENGTDQASAEWLTSPSRRFVQAVSITFSRAPRLLARRSSTRGMTVQPRRAGLGHNWAKHAPAGSETAGIAEKSQRENYVAVRRAPDHSGHLEFSSSASARQHIVVRCRTRRHSRITTSLQKPAQFNQC